MTTLSKAKPRDFEIGNFRRRPMIANETIFEGAAVGINSAGYAKPLTAGNIFIGFARHDADNETGLLGEELVELFREGEVQLPVTAVTETCVGQAVFAVDDDTFTLTQSTNSYLGRITRVPESGQALVAFDASIPRGGLQIAAATTSLDSCKAVINAILAMV